MIARRASISVPMDDEEPAQKQGKVVSSRLQDSIIMSTFGARLPTCAAIRDSHLVAYYEVLDRFSAEMERRLLKNNSTLIMLATSDPRDERRVEVILSERLSFQHHRDRDHYAAESSEEPPARKELRGPYWMSGVPPPAGSRL